MYRSNTRMKKKLFVDIVIFLSSAVLAETDPCQRYDLLSMHDGRRSVNYRTQRLDIPICDRIYVQTGWWYKFAYNETNYKIPEDCAQFGSCGTVAPIWMNGSHPSDYARIERNSLCVNMGRSCCDLTASVNVTRCQSGHGGDFYLYQLTDPGTCHLGFCVTPSKENKYNGNEIQCDRRLGCSQVTVDHARHIGFVFEHSFICNYIDVDEGTNVTYGIIFRTSTTAQCPVPDRNITQKYKSITKQYNLTVKYRDSRKPGIHVVWEPTVLVVVQNLGYQIVEDANHHDGSGVDLSVESDWAETGSGEYEIERSYSAQIEPSTTKVEPSETERATTSLTTSQQSMTDSYSLSQTATETDIDAVSETLLV